jgi:lipoate-protein ligase B
VDGIHYVVSGAAGKLRPEPPSGFADAGTRTWAAAGHFLLARVDVEHIVIRAAADVGVALERNDVQTGVWAGNRKVCAIGVRLMRMRVSLHGFALNCTTDLAWYDAIVPCGLPDEGVTSLSELAGRVVTVSEMMPLVARRFGEVFDRRLEPQGRTWPEQPMHARPASISAASSS